MKKLVKVTVLAVFGISILGLFLTTAGASGITSLTSWGAAPTPTPPRANANAVNKPANMSAANTKANAAIPVSTAPANMASNTVPPTGGGKTIPKNFTLATDSQDENGEVAFNHDNHAFLKYNPEGTAAMGCVECHHTDAPKSALKAPYVTSERDVVLTFESWKTSSQPVTKCRSCHFQEGSVPDGKEMPQTTKELNNRIAYHINCNDCHDAAAKARPDLKKKPGFATGKDCGVCHKIG
jgi:Class III cytochrome C family